MKKKIFLTGASGKLGSTLISYLEKNYNLFSIGFKKKPKNGLKLNLTNSSEVNNVLNKVKPDIIIHLAALTNVDECESNFAKAYNLNCNATRYLVYWAHKKNCRFLYLSTDQIYNNPGFNSEENENPCNVYSQTKFVSENIVLCLNNSVVVRTNFYGFFPNHKDSLVNWFIKCAKKNIKIKLIKNIYFNPLYVHQLCLYLLEIIKNYKIKGIFNLGAKNKISKGELLFKIGEKINYKKKKMKFQNVEFFKLKAYRPRNMVMKVDKIEKILKKSMPTINLGLDSLIFKIKRNDTFNY